MTELPTERKEALILGLLLYDTKKPCKHGSNRVNHSNSLRRAARLKRTPKWADLRKIEEIYLNFPEGHHVDHIYPLLGKNVSGLHVENNLQYLTAEENLRKGNSYKPLRLDA